MTTEDKLKQRKNDYIKTFQTDFGKRVLKELEDMYFIHKPTFILGDSQATSYNEGQRTVVLHIHAMRNLDIEKLKKQLKEEE